MVQEYVAFPLFMLGDWADGEVAAPSVHCSVFLHVVRILRLRSRGFAV
jgi:hypothetical protein